MDKPARRSREVHMVDLILVLLVLSSIGVMAAPHFGQFRAHFFGGGAVVHRHHGRDRVARVTQYDW